MRVDVCEQLPAGTEVGPQVPLKALCGCKSGSGRTMPLWKQTATADAVGRQLRDVLIPDMVLLTYRCPECRQQVVITLDTLFNLTNSNGSK